MTDELNQDDMSFIDSIASNQMGVTPQQPQPQAEQPAPQVEPKDKPTAQEQATADVAPQTEQSNSQKAPFEFFDVDGQAYTPEQLKGMVTRYKGLNYKHQTEVAPNQKTLGFINQLRAAAAEDGQELTDEQLTDFLAAAADAYAKNPEMGNKGKAPAKSDSTTRQDIDMSNQHQPVDASSLEAQLGEWEEQNAITLPPAFKQSILASHTQGAQIAELTSLVKQLTTQNATTAATAEDKLKQAKDTHADAGRQKIQNNLARIQNEFQFPNEAEQDFMAFVQERGYDVWELMDYPLAQKLATDFKNTQAAPELERLRAAHQRRQAFTGSLSPSPGNMAPAPQTQGDSDADFINQVADQHMKSRNMM